MRTGRNLLAKVRGGCQDVKTNELFFHFSFRDNVLFLNDQIKKEIGHDISSSSFDTIEKRKQSISLIEETIEKLKFNSNGIKIAYDDEAYSKAMQDYYKKVSLVEEMYINDLFNSLSISKSNKLEYELAELAYSEAYDRGHSGGHNEVEQYFHEYFDLFQKVKNIVVTQNHPTLEKFSL